MQKEWIPEADFAFLRTAECFVACQLAIHLRRLIRQSMPMFFALTGGAVVALIMVASYQLEPRRLLTTAAALQVVIVVLLQVIVFLRLEREDLLRRVAGTGRARFTLSRGLVLKVTTWVVLPLVIVVLMRYPRAAIALEELAEPIRRVFLH
jgi:hypothetical protein